MNMLEFRIDSPVAYNYTGKFEAPSANWMHEDFLLLDYELFVMTQGILYIEHNKKRYEVKEGEFLLLPPLPPPSDHRKGYLPSDCSFYWMHFEPSHPLLTKRVLEENLASYSSTLSKNTLSLPITGAIPKQEKIVVLMKQLQDAVRNQYPTVILNYMTTVVLCELYAQFNEQFQITGTVRKTQKQIYHDIIDYVKQNTTQNLKVSDVAAHFGYNEKYLSHLFRSIANIPLKQFILSCKMDEANYLLTDTNQSIRVIASALGFSDNHNFSKAYKKITGLTPTEYRNAFSKRMLFHK